MRVNVVDEIQHVPAGGPPQFLVMHADQLEVVKTKSNDRVLGASSLMAAAGDAIEAETSVCLNCCVQVSDSDHCVIKSGHLRINHSIRAFSVAR
jgi:hypothetical protein